MGQYHPERAEIDPGTVARATHVPGAAAKLLDDRAREAGVGTSLELSPASEAFPGR